MSDYYRDQAFQEADSLLDAFGEPIPDELRPYVRALLGAASLAGTIRGAEDSMNIVRAMLEELKR